MAIATPPPRQEPHAGPGDPLADAGHRGIGVALLVLAAALALNTALGPLFADVVDYPFSASMRHQTIGLEAVSLALVAPWCVATAVLAWRGHTAAPVLALGPSAFVVYMFAQYVVGPEYRAYPAVLPLHLALFILGGAVLLTAWSASGPAVRPALPRSRARRWAAIVLVPAAFTASLYGPVFTGVVTGASLPADALEDVSMYWTIVLLDLGVVVPAAVAIAVGLLWQRAWAATALHALIGWFALVPASVAAMSVVMLRNQDPHATPAATAVFVVMALVFAGITAALYRPLLRPRPRPGNRG